MLTSFFQSPWPWLLALTVTAAVTDLRTGLIPNLLTLPTLVITPLVRLAIAGPGALDTCLVGALLCGGVPALLFAARAMGGGDVKLFAAIGALTGPLTGLEIQLTAYLLALLYALCLLAYRGTLIATLLRALRLLVPRRRARRAHDTTSPAHAPTQAVADAATSLRLGAPILAATLLALALRVLEA